MKKLYRLVLKSYLGPFIMTFFIALFILLMQFLWKYIDDLVGKGLDWIIIAKLLLYASFSLVPLALPLAILLSSIMTFGNLGEHYELVACKAAGISLQKVMFPLIIGAFIISTAAFFFSNYALPYANLKMGSLLYDVRQQKPAFSLKEGVFYNGIEGYSIKIGKKDPDGQTLYNLMIYDHTSMVGNVKVILAEKGMMYMSDDEKALLLNLYNGNSYEERSNIKYGYDTHPLLRTHFQEETVRFDLSGFKLNRTNEELFKDNYQMLNLKQLVKAEDTLREQYTTRKKEYVNNINSYFYYKKDTSIKEIQPAKLELKNPDFLLNFEKQQRINIVQTALNLARGAESYANSAKEELQERNKLIFRHQIEWHRKFTLSFACLILFFIGAPLGAIIRKGGLGLPVVVSTIFFVLYHVLSITGEKFSREGVISAWQGMWLSSVILLPLGIFLTYKATTDSALFDIDAYRKGWIRIRKFFKF